MTKPRGPGWADLILAEGRLGTLRYCDQDMLRCASGVIGDWRWTGEGYNRKRLIACFRAYGSYWHTSMSMDNDGYDGTPEERCLYMAERVRVLA